MALEDLEIKIKYDKPKLSMGFRWHNEISESSIRRNKKVNTCVNMCLIKNRFLNTNLRRWYYMS